jgi:hypothetical protein
MGQKWIPSRRIVLGTAVREDSVRSTHAQRKCSQYMRYGHHTTEEEKQYT